ncbi:hypothetical protein MJO28_015702 [Puccinia striiformis f. sp. tritici]|uniref:Uncharacterized protein n=1 Tax=Puccinia striiformis f. sp. tritici TaxID=168172 RepID=A0ACC0DPS5_9BASI|nr:hypothetical protein MJO28_015702 [Puccinia striiformis f. sp. tritici]
MTLFLDSRGLLEVCTQVPPFILDDDDKAKNAVTLFHLASTIDKLIYNSVFKLNPGASAYTIWKSLKSKYAKQLVFSTGRVWRQWDKIFCTGTLMDYIERTYDCLGEFKNIGIDVTSEIFAACIISRVTEAKPLLMETLAADEEVVSSAALASGLSNKKGKKREKEWDCTNGHDYNSNHSKKKCWEENPQLKPKKF